MNEQEDKEFDMIIDFLFQQYLTATLALIYSIPSVPEIKRTLIMDYLDHECKYFCTFSSRDE
jgi:hypothetical protein